MSVGRIAHVDAPSLETRAISNDEYLKVVSGVSELKSKAEASMKQKLILVGLDVDDTQYHKSALDKHTGEVIDFRCRPTLKGLFGELIKQASIIQGACSSSVMKPPTSAIPCNGI